MLDTLSIVKTPTAARKLFGAALWKVKTKEKVLYLTFDDGPIDEVTPQILDCLYEYKAKATFFCIGKNITAQPALYERIIAEGHSIGNHTQQHLNGWHTENAEYYEGVEECGKVMRHSANGHLHMIDGQEATFFRPPYGKLTITQYNHLKNKYKIVMWDVLAFDFDLKVSKEQVLNNVLKNTVAGSIIVFHDSLKAKEKVLYALPKVLEHYIQQGYRFERLVHS